MLQEEESKAEESKPAEEAAADAPAETSAESAAEEAKPVSCPLYFHPLGLRGIQAEEKKEDRPKSPGLLAKLLAPFKGHEKKEKTEKKPKDKAKKAEKKEEVSIDLSG